MSASNWEVCPKCLAEAEAAAKAAEEEVASLYGKVPVDEFDRLRGEIPVVNPESHCSFREDYEIHGASKGVVKVRYQGQCTECGLRLELGVDKPFWPADDRPAVIRER